MTLRIGERVRVETRAVEPQSAGCEAVALGEDRHRVLNPDRALTVPGESPQALADRAGDEVWELGSVVLRRSAGLRVFDVVVYDLDASPMVRRETVEQGLGALLARLAQERVARVAMEPIGMAHRGLAAAEFAHALRRACAEAVADLEIVLCHPEPDALDSVARRLAVLH